MKFSSVAAFIGVTATAVNPSAAKVTADTNSVLESLSKEGLLPTDKYSGEWSSAFESLKSEGRIPKTMTAAPPHHTGYGPGQGPVTAHQSGGQFRHGPPGGGPWGGPDGCGPWGSGTWGPFSHWSTDSEWRTKGPWTEWWGGSACPGSDWPGWTEGPWSTEAPWTTWSGCTAETTATSVVSTTVSGKETVSTAYGVQVAQASPVTINGTPTSVPASGAAGDARTAGPLVALGAAIMGLAAAL